MTGVSCGHPVTSVSYVLRGRYRPLPYTGQAIAGDLIISSNRQSVWAVWKDGSRRALNPEQVRTITTELERRLSLPAYSDPSLRLPA